MLHNQNGQSMYNRQSLQPEKEYGYPGVSGQHVYGASNSNVTDTYPQGHPNSSFQPPPNYCSGNQGQTFQPQSQPPYYSAQSIQSVNQPPLPPMPPIPNHQDFVQRPQQPRLPPMPPMPPGHEGVPPPSYRQPQPPGPFPLPNGANTQINTLHSQQAYQNGPVSRQPQFSQSINADRLPSPIEVIESNRAQCTGPFYTGQRGVVPPLVTTDFISRDQGTCAPCFIRSSLYSVPNSSDLLKTVGIPFSLTISPFAVQHTEDMNVVISDMGPQGPVRCVRCKAYMNPFMNFIDGGRRFQCPLCNGLTEVAAEYFAHLDHTGRRVDAGQRPELCLGSYELLATAEYCKNNQLPLPPAIIFLLDVSQSAIRSGLVQLFCSQFVERILPNLPREKFTSPDMVNPIRLGFITYDHQLHFYTVPRESSSSAQQTSESTDQNTYNSYGKPQMYIVADIEDVFVPTVEGFLIPPDPAIISSILEMIPTQFCTENALNRQPTDSVLGPAIQSGMEALRAANRSGKLFVIHANLPIGEAPGKLKNRDDRRLIGTEKEKTLLLPDNDFYVGLGQTCVEVGCSVDLFLFPNSFVDIASLAEVPRLTSGHLFKYNCFQADLQGHQFIADLQRTLTNLQAFNAVMRVRTSTGIRPVEFFGNCYLPNTTDVELASVSSDMAITAELRHDDKLQEGEHVFIQVACLYTSISGQRRLRIHNLSIPVTTDGITIDDRCWQMFLVNQMDVKQSNCYIYPHLYPIHDLSLNFEGDIHYPPAAIRCSYDRLQMDAAYLLDNGIYLIMWIGPNISSEWIQAVFNVQNPEHFESEKIYDLCNFDNEISRNLCTLLKKVRKNRWHYSRLLVVRPGDKSELWFRRFMVEDRCSGNSISYTEYLCHIHKEVSSLLH
ncbi:unnamed protein product [Schistosoma intercalatum]|nr:unnamed protein product [Schistosoma intercalatum]CAH8581564.1 unnamed protein product [Schistosoma intercalatum]